jgi:hypothetical protein
MSRQILLVTIALLVGVLCSGAYMRMRLASAQDELAAAQEAYRETERMARSVVTDQSAAPTANDADLLSLVRRSLSEAAVPPERLDGIQHRSAGMGVGTGPQAELRLTGIRPGELLAWRSAWSTIAPGWSVVSCTITPASAASGASPAGLQATLLLGRTR